MLEEAMDWIVSAGRRYATATMAVGLLAVLATSIAVTHLVAPHVGTFSDLLGRLANLRDLQSTGNIYVPFDKEAFTYPPGAVLLFWPILWIGQSLVPLVWTIFSLAALVGTIFAGLKYLLHQSVTWSLAVACWMAVLSVALFPPVLEDLSWGQTGTFLLLLVALDSLLIRGKTKGILVGLATAFKIYPGVFIIIFLLRRQWRAAINATVTAVATTGLAWILWPKSVSYFFSKELLGGGELAHFRGGTQAAASSSLVDFLFRAPFRIPPTTFESVTVFLLVVIVGLMAARTLWRQGFELSSTLVALIASVVGAPIAWDHYFVFASLLLLVPIEMGWHHALSRTAVAAAAVMVVPWYRFRRPAPGSWWVSTYVFVSRNAILFAALSILLVATFETLKAARFRVHATSLVTRPKLVFTTPVVAHFIRAIGHGGREKLRSTTSFVQQPELEAEQAKASARVARRRAKNEDGVLSEPA